MLLRVPQVLFMQWHVSKGARTPLWSQPLFTSHSKLEFGRTWYLEALADQYVGRHVSRVREFLLQGLTVGYASKTLLRAKADPRRLAAFPVVAEYIHYFRPPRQ